MRKIGMDELRQKQMEVLDYVSSFCDQQGIRYWIEGGTLLGADTKDIFHGMTI